MFINSVLRKAKQLKPEEGKLAIESAKYKKFRQAYYVPNTPITVTDASAGPVNFSTAGVDLYTALAPGMPVVEYASNAALAQQIIDDSVAFFTS